MLPVLVMSIHSSCRIWIHYYSGETVPQLEVATDYILQPRFKSEKQATELPEQT
jgi:hypothetical protein